MIGRAAQVRPHKPLVCRLLHGEPPWLSWQDGTIVWQCRTCWRRWYGLSFQAPAVLTFVPSAAGSVADSSTPICNADR